MGEKVAILWAGVVRIIPGDLDPGLQVGRVNLNGPREVALDG